MTPSRRASTRSRYLSTVREMPVERLDPALQVQQLGGLQHRHREQPAARVALSARVSASRKGTPVSSVNFGSTNPDSSAAVPPSRSHEVGDLVGGADPDEQQRQRRRRAGRRVRRTAGRGWPRRRRRPGRRWSPPGTAPSTPRRGRPACGRRRRGAGGWPGCRGWRRGRRRGCGAGESAVNSWGSRWKSSPLRSEREMSEMSHNAPFQIKRPCRHLADYRTYGRGVKVPSTRDEQVTGAGRPCDHRARSRTAPPGSGAFRRARAAPLRQRYDGRARTARGCGVVARPRGRAGWPVMTHAMVKGSNIPLDAPGIRAVLRWSPGPGVPGRGRLGAAARPGRPGPLRRRLRLLQRAPAPLGPGPPPAEEARPRGPDRHRRGRPGRAGRRRSTGWSSPRPATAAPFRHVTRPAAGCSTTRPTAPQHAAPVVTFDVVPDTGQETALICGEVYRKGAGWKFRALGQGYATGLVGPRHRVRHRGRRRRGRPGARPPPQPAAAPHRARTRRRRRPPAPTATRSRPPPRPPTCPRSPPTATRSPWRPPTRRPQPPAGPRLPAARAGPPAAAAGLPGLRLPAARRGHRGGRRSTPHRARASTRGPQRRRRVHAAAAGPAVPDAGGVEHRRSQTFDL